ncbi:hypothetical protein [Paracoccus sediminicola]|uniref:hypothetical protein n=1 Tax=Paracoccus sediminicola TaxID=3017783 RepID=UPI0022F017AD|nr:hypothetical protein [Paracoccus sediminicola]WBU57229.1 hypothetical protein PAF18_01915 [Paracoccus sediminicola]
MSILDLIFALFLLDVVWREAVQIAPAGSDTEITVTPAPDAAPGDDAEIPDMPELPDAALAPLYSDAAPAGGAVERIELSDGRLCELRDVVGPDAEGVMTFTLSAISETGRDYEMPVRLSLGAAEAAGDDRMPRLAKQDSCRSAHDRIQQIEQGE